MIIMKPILICTPFTILPNYYVASLLLWLTTFPLDMAFKRFTSDTSVKREWTNMNGALVIIIHSWCRCSMAAAYRASIMSLGMMVTRFTQMAHKLCPQTIQQGKLPKSPGGQVLLCFGNDSLTWNLEQPLVPNIGMVPCKSKGQPTFGISGSLEAAIERNVKVVFRVRVWHCVFTIDAHSRWTYRHRAQTVPMRLFDASSRWQCFPCRLFG
jgi:hypothetical protein